MKTVIIDDKSSVRESLKMLLELFAPDIDLLGEADGVRAGLACIQQHQPELVLLDVEMGDGTGFDLLALCPNPTFKVIFITGHDAYAIRAFKFSAIDYLLKPVDPDELVKALEKAKAQLHHVNQSLPLKNLLQNQKVDDQQQKMLLSDADNIYLISIGEIIRCQSEGNYTRFFLTKDRVVLISKTLKEYATLLEHLNFFRAHQSHLINLAHFSRFEKKDGGTIYMKDGSFLPVAVRRKEELLNLLKRQ